jgi:HAE1 family hydrophobic/amphiphilic exporter-1
MTPETITTSLDELVARALANRPELTQLGVTEDITRIQEQYYRDQTRPQVDLVGTYGMAGLSGTPALDESAHRSADRGQHQRRLSRGYGQSLDGLLARAYPTARIDLRVGLPIGNRTAQANLALAQTEREQATRHRAALEQQIEADVRSALQSVRSAEALSQRRTSHARRHNSSMRASCDGSSRGCQQCFSFCSGRRTTSARRPKRSRRTQI